MNTQTGKWGMGIAVVSSLLVSLTACITPPPPQANLPQTTQPATGRQTRALKDVRSDPDQSQLLKLVVTVEYEPVQSARSGRIAFTFTIQNRGDQMVPLSNPVDISPIIILGRGGKSFHLPQLSHRLETGRKEHVLPFRFVEMSLNGRVLTKPEVDEYQVNLPPQGRLQMTMEIDRVVQENSKSVIKPSAGEYTVWVTMPLFYRGTPPTSHRTLDTRDVIVRLE